MAEGRIIIKGENNISSSVKSAQKDLNSLNNTVQNLSKTFKTAFTATAILAGLNKIAKTVTSLAKEYMEVEQSISKLSASSTLYGQNLSELTNIVETFSKQTMESKDTVRDMVSQLSALGKSENDISKITEASIALSNVTGKSLTESFNQMLSTLKGEVGELSKLDTSFQNLTSEQLKHGDAVDIVIKKYGELSKSMASASLSQDWKNISDTFSSIKQNAGKIILQFAEDIGFTDKLSTILESINDWVEKIYLRQIGVYDIYEDAVSDTLKLGTEGLLQSEASDIIDKVYSKFFKPYFEEEIKRDYVSLVDQYGAKENIPNEEIENLFKPFRDALNTHFSDLIGNVTAIGNVIEERAKEEERVRKIEKKYANYNPEISAIEDSLNTLIDYQAELRTEWLNHPYRADGSYSDAYWELKESPQELGFIMGGEYTVIQTNGLDNLINQINSMLSGYRAGYSTDVLNYKTPDILKVDYDPSFIDTGVRSYRSSLNSDTTSTYTYNPSSRSFNFNILKKDLPSIESNTDATALTLSNTQDKVDSITSLLEMLPSGLVEALPNYGYDIDKQYDVLTKIFDYMQKGDYTGAVGTAFEENFGSIISNLGLGTTELVDGYNALFTEGIEGIFTAIQPLTDIIFAASPILALLLAILQDFVDTLLPAIETILAPIMDFLGSIGKLLAQTLYPILEALYPWIMMIVNVLANLVYPIIRMITPIMQVIAGILEALKPVLSIVLDAFTAIAIVLNWVASLFEYVGDVVVTFGQNVGIALWNVLHPFDQKGYKSTTKSYKSFKESANEVLLSNSNAFSSSVDLATSTSTAVQNASYAGGGTVTINIYQQGVVVGDTGMEEFARMIRNEFASLDYYGT